MVCRLVAALSGAACALLVIGDASSSATPQAPGIAAQYPGDRGIERHPAVLFHEDFESQNLRRWDEVNGTAALTSLRPHAGSGCLAIPMQQGQNTGGSLINWFLPGKDTVFVRFYVRFSSNYRYAHHFVTLMASPPDDRWRPFGKAGLKPDGSYFSTGMEPWFAWGRNPSPGEVSFYSYYPDMEIDPKMNKYWGNQFFPPGPGKGQAAGPRRLIPPLDKWQCWEFMVQANSSPDKANGRQAMWVDGKLVAEFPGIRWRTRTDTRINCLWLQHYGYDDSDPTRAYWKDEQTAWFDDIVVATQYIGPMAPGGQNVPP
ncbi:MAG: hypothetical protein ACP5VE_05600 [Chthonomonadales bacterium]